MQPYYSLMDATCHLYIKKRVTTCYGCCTAVAPLLLRKIPLFRNMHVFYQSNTTCDRDLNFSKISQKPKEGTRTMNFLYKILQNRTKVTQTMDYLIIHTSLLTYSLYCFLCVWYYSKYASTSGKLKSLPDHT